MNAILIAATVLAVAVIMIPNAAAHTDEQDSTYSYVPTSYLLERNYADWSDQYESEADLLGWYVSARTYLAWEPDNEFNLLMQEGWLHRENFDTVVGTIDASFEVAAYMVAAQMLDGTYWSISEQNDRFWNDLLEHYGLTDADDSQVLRDAIYEMTGGMHQVHILEWITVLEYMVYHGYTTPEQYVADPAYWAEIARKSPLTSTPVGEAAPDEDGLTANAWRGKLSTTVSTYNSHDRRTYAGTVVSYGGTQERGSWTKSATLSGTTHGAAGIITTAIACADPPVYSAVTVKAKAYSKTPSDRDSTPYKTKSKNTSGEVCVTSATAHANHVDPDDWRWTGKATGKISYRILHNA